jgi:hypothetical protein
MPTAAAWKASAVGNGQLYCIGGVRRAFRELSSPTCRSTNHRESADATSAPSRTSEQGRRTPGTAPGRIGQFPSDRVWPDQLPIEEDTVEAGGSDGEVRRGYFERTAQFGSCHLWYDADATIRGTSQITSVMSSCCSLPLLNCWTAPTTGWRRAPTGR